MWSVVAGVAAKSLLGGFDAGSQIKTQIAQSKATQAQLAKGISQINLQRSQSRTATNSALFNVKQQKQQALSQVGLQAAASDTIGASVKDAVATVNVTSARADASVRGNQSAQEEGFFQQSTALVDNARANTSQQTGQDIVFNAALGIAGSYIGSAAADATLGDFDYSEWGDKVGSTLTSWKSYLGG